MLIGRFFIIPRNLKSLALARNHTLSVWIILINSSESWQVQILKPAQSVEHCDNPLYLRFLVAAGPVKKSVPLYLCQIHGKRKQSCEVKLETIYFSRKHVLHPFIVPIILLESAYLGITRRLNHLLWENPPLFDHSLFASKAQQGGIFPREL